MGLVPQLTVTLSCLLACAGTLVHGCDGPLQETIYHLNTLLREKTLGTELDVADVFAVPKDTVEEKLCRAVKVLQHTAYFRVGVSCANRPRESLCPELLKGVYRNLRSMVQPNCPVNELKRTTLKDFLENLTSTLHKKYSECRPSLF